MRSRSFALLALATLLVPLASAQADSMPSPPPRGTVWTVLTTVEAVVNDNYATVRVIADIGNRGPDPEFPFQVRVPDDAFVTGLTIERDGKVYEATIKGRDEARAEYEDWKQAQQTGGLVEKTRRSSVYSYLINVAEFTNVRATLTYERYLAADKGVYGLALEAPVSGFGEDQGARFDVTLRHRDGVSAAWGSPATDAQRDGSNYRLQHAVGPRLSDASTPFEASYTLSATDDAGSLVTTIHNGTGYFAHRFRAPADDKQLPVDLVLVLDISGSMTGLKLQQMKDAAAQMLQTLGPEDRLHVVFFSGDANAPWSGFRDMTIANRAAAVEEIRGTIVAGGTNIESAIRAGFEAMDGVDWSKEEGRFPLLVFLTDGQPTVGNTDRSFLRTLARDANSHDINVFAIAFGSDADWAFIRALADEADGTALRVPEGAGAEVDLRRFMEALTTPVLKDVRISYPEGVTAYRTTAPILFAGSELLVVGTFDVARGLPTATVRGTAPDGPREYKATAVAADGLSFLPRLVAYHRIRALQDLVDTEGARAEWEKDITDLALRHGFVTDYTSLVVTLDARESAPQPTWDAATLNSSADADGTAVSGAPSTSGSPFTLSDRSGVADRGLTIGHTAPTTATTASPATGSQTPTSSARVPGAGALVALVALALMALALRERRT